MGRTLENKKELVAELKADLEQAQIALIIDYAGLTVSEITDLRRRLQASGTVCTVAKNTLMRIAVQDNPTWQPMTEFLAQSTAVLFVKEDIAGAIKAYQDFQKASKKTELRGGVMEGRALNPDNVKAIGDLPSKEQLMGQVAGAINSLATKIAVGINEIPGSLARAVKAVSEKEAA